MEDTIKLPLDADGVPIRPGDVVYRHSVPHPLKVKSVQLTCHKLAPWEIYVAGDDVFSYMPKNFSHTKPDTLEDIEAIIRELIQSNEKWALSEIPDLMERIKRMVER